MRPQKIDDIKLLEGLMTTFRTKGYNGASLNDFANSSGLQKASLYHRFPGGKKDIGLAVLNFVEAWKKQNIVAVIKNKDLKPSERLSTILKNISSIYENGECSCVMRALSMGDGLDLFGEELKLGVEKWLEALTELGLDFRFEQQVAEEKAMQTLVKIQGSLIVSKSLNNTQPFTMALNEIESLYKNT